MREESAQDDGGVTATLNNPEWLCSCGCCLSRVKNVTLCFGGMSSTQFQPPSIYKYKVMLRRILSQYTQKIVASHYWTKVFLRSVLVHAYRGIPWPNFKVKEKTSSIPCTSFGDQIDTIYATRTTTGHINSVKRMGIPWSDKIFSIRYFIANR